MKRCVIVGAAEIGRYDIARRYVLPGDFCIFCDGGLRHLEPLGLRPDLIVGDFDSWDLDSLNFCSSESGSRENEIPPGTKGKCADSLGETCADSASCPPIIRLPREKDDTDTFFAAKKAVEMGFDEFVLLGAAGGRLDHTLGNVSILLYLAGLGKRALMVDDYSETEIVTDKAPALIPDSFAFFSLVNISGNAGEITIEEAKYCLKNGIIRCDYQYGISNEVLPGKTARVTLSGGELLLVKIF